MVITSRRAIIHLRELLDGSGNEVRNHRRRKQADIRKVVKHHHFIYPQRDADAGKNEKPNDS